MDKTGKLHKSNFLCQVLSAPKSTEFLPRLHVVSMSDVGWLRTEAELICSLTTRQTGSIL